MLRNVLFLICATSVIRAIPRPAVEGDEVSEDVCSLPSTTGEITCSGVFYRWTFNTKTQDCEKIVYGGCYGTAKLFRNQYACLAKCNQKGLQRLISEGDPSSQPCLLPKVVGGCRAQIPSFYFEPTTGICTPFDYGGCDGNANNFETLSGCEKSCYGPNSLFDQPVSSDLIADTEDPPVLTTH